MILTTLFWAGNFITRKYMIAELSAIQLTFLRWLLSIILLFPLAHWIERPDWKKVWSEWKKLLTMALLGLIGYNLVLYTALLFTTPLNASLINSLNLVTIFLCSSLFLSLPSYISRNALLGVLYIAIFPSVISFLLWTAAVLKVKAGHVGVFSNSITVFTAIISVLLGNAITFIQILGGSIVFIGVYFATQTKRNNTSKSTSN